ncbi:hypothetical protein ABIE33_005601 [Ensifer sp. 4252]
MSRAVQKLPATAAFHAIAEAVEMLPGGVVKGIELDGRGDAEAVAHEEERLAPSRLNSVENGIQENFGKFRGGLHGYALASSFTMDANTEFDLALAEEECWGSHGRYGAASERRGHRTGFCVHVSADLFADFERSAPTI